MLRIFGLAVVGLWINSCDSEAVLVNVENGPLRGEQRDGYYYAFEGIPYARAPLGDLRLAPSVLNDERWKEPRDALKPGSWCIQWNHFLEDDFKVVGEEDCLFLNVYTPNLSPNVSMPTFFYIHGGAFMFGSGDYYRPDHLMKQPVIVVTINYRLGPMGFMSTEDDVIPGNFGLKDQVTALEWVRRNIASFGGHPEQITLVGFSAGSASVEMHYLSPMSRDLFKNAIGHSGSALNPWVLVENSTAKAKKVASSVGCQTSASKEMLACLRAAPAQDIVGTVKQFFGFMFNPFSPFGAVVEVQSDNNPKPFLIDHPYNLMRAGKVKKAPLILSATDAEGLYPAGAFIRKKEYLEDIDKNWNALLPAILDYQTSLDADVKGRNQISETIRKRYLKDQPLTEDNFRDFVKIISNRLYFAGITTSAKLLKNHIPVYFYYDVYKTQYGLGEHMSYTSTDYGVAHGEDILLIFKTDMRDGNHPYSEEERLMSDRFVQLYEGFSRDRPPHFGPHALPRMEPTDDRLRFLELSYPESWVRLRAQLSDEDFWNRIDFHDGMPVQESRNKTEL
ncbi:venom carboxylesterase-6-like [Uranotaenia lowii]|uniref:venom carboxylesterase-6-like n=1 Tax=Uranotaenia lowii TaxID=190385 RepID=UPI002478F29D|nr:venom carboxylesterase-6-like [Uranotaenia lowii]